MNGTPGGILSVFKGAVRYWALAIRWATISGLFATGERKAKHTRAMHEDRGRDEGFDLTPPSEPDVRISRIRLSGQWGLSETNHTHKYRVTDCIVLARQTNDWAIVDCQLYLTRS